MPILRQHKIILQKGNITLRPMTENDWDILLKWNSNPEILYFTDGDKVSSYNLEQTQYIYRSVSQKAFCFIIEDNGQPIGECWLQEMNLERILQKYPDSDCRRIDIMIGNKDYWNQGIGTEAIRLLTEFGFLKEKATMIFGCDIADYNVRSLRAFQKAGYTIITKMRDQPNAKANYKYDVALTCKSFREFHEGEKERE